MDGKLLGFTECMNTSYLSQEKAEKALKRTTRPPAITLPKDETLEAPPSPKPLRRSSRLPATKVHVLLVLRSYLDLLFTIFKMFLKGVLCGHGQQY